MNMLMFRLTENFEIFKSSILGSSLFEIENVFHDHEWVLDYVQHRPSSTHFNVYKDPKTYKEHSVIVSNTHIRELQQRLSLLCEQQPIDPGICHINFIKLVKPNPKFIERPSHKGYTAVLYLRDHTGPDIDLVHKTTNVNHRTYAVPNKLVLYDNQLFNTKYVFDDSFYTTETCVTLLMYFAK